MPANDDPHGVFSLNPVQQSVVVVGSGSEVNRTLIVNVTRLAGLFGNVSVGYKISGEVGKLMDIQEILGGRAEGRLLMTEGQTFKEITIPISSEVRKRRFLKETLIKSSLIDLIQFKDIYFLFFLSHRHFCRWVRASPQSSLTLD